MLVGVSGLSANGSDIPFFLSAVTCRSGIFVIFGLKEPGVDTALGICSGDSQLC